VTLSTDAIISLGSTGVTLFSMGLTIWMARDVKKIRDQIAVDIRRVNLTHASRSLEKTLAEIRKLQDSTAANSRGRGRASLLDAVQAQFDVALMQIDLNGPDSDVRGVISNAQTKLQQLRIEQNDAVCATITSEMQSLIQDAVSLLNGRSLKLEGKAQ
jgi:type IV secretory pathway TraG/TraD family ATPase VirD4